MGMFDDFPWLNTHELNLDWILDKLTKPLRIQPRLVDAYGTNLGTTKLPVPSAKHTTVTEFTPERGFLYIYDFYADFASNPTGIRAIFYAQTPDATPDERDGSASYTKTAALTTGGANLHLPRFIVGDGVKRYLRVYQNSGEELTTTVRVCVIALPIYESETYLTVPKRDIPQDM